MPTPKTYRLIAAFNVVAMFGIHLVWALAEGLQAHWGTCLYFSTVALGLGVFLIYNLSRPRDEFKSFYRRSRSRTTRRTPGRPAVGA